MLGNLVLGFLVISLIFTNVSPNCIFGIEVPLTKNRPENCGQRASLAVLGCLRLEQQNSWNLALQNVEQLKWILSQTGGDGEETNHSCPPLSPASSCA